VYFAYECGLLALVADFCSHGWVQAVNRHCRELFGPDRPSFDGGIDFFSKNNVQMS
jgi:hypothetical protein